MSLFRSSEGFLIISGGPGPIGPVGPEGPQGPPGPPTDPDSIVDFLDTVDYASENFALAGIQTKFSIPDGTFRLAYSVNSVNFVAEVTYVSSVGTVDSQISPLPESVFNVNNGLAYSNNSSFWDFIIIRQTSEQGITASATQTQGQQPLTEAFNLVQAVASPNDVVTLPPDPDGRQVQIFNDGGNTLRIFPASGDDLGNGLNQPFDLLDGESISFSGFDDTNWKISELQKKFNSIELVLNGLIQPLAVVAASTTQVQGEGNINFRFNVATTISNENDVVTLPAAALGLQISVANVVTNTLQIFPILGGKFRDLSVNAPIFLKGGQQVTFTGLSGLEWLPDTITVLELNSLEMLTDDFIRTEGITFASTTQTQGQELLLFTLNRVAVGNQNDVVTVPDGVKGKKIEIANDDLNNTLQVFPSVGNEFGLGLNVPLFLLPGESIALFSSSTTSWRIVGRQKKFSSIELVTNDFVRTVEDGITASTTQSQGVGNLTETFNNVSTVANPNDVVTLPTAVKGITVFIKNQGLNVLQIFPALGDDLGEGPNLSTTLGINEDIEFVALSDAVWTLRTTTETFHGEYHQENNVTAYVIDTSNEIHSYHSLGITSGDLAGMNFDASGAGTPLSILSVTDAGGGDILVEVLGHGVGPGDVISQTGMTNAGYNGIFIVVTLFNVNNYIITAAFVGTDTGTMNGAATLEVNANAAGVYALDYSFSATPAVPNESFNFQIYKNDVKVLGTKRTIRFGPAGDFRVIAGSGIDNFGALDKVSFALENLNTAGNVTIEDLSLRAIRL